MELICVYCGEEREVEFRPIKPPIILEEFYKLQKKIDEAGRWEVGDKGAVCPKCQGLGLSLEQYGEKGDQIPIVEEV